MDNYFNEIIGAVKLPFNEINKDTKIMLVGNKVLYVSNYIKILDYSTERIVVKVYKNILEILGQNISISQINKREMIIKGTLNVIQYSEGNNEKNK